MGSCAESIRDDLSKGKMICSEKGVNRNEKNIGDYSVSFFPEARTRGIETVSMRRLASTQSKYDGTN